MCITLSFEALISWCLRLFVYTVFTVGKKVYLLYKKASEQAAAGIVAYSPDREKFIENSVFKKEC